MEIVGVIAFYVLVFAVILALRYAARADVNQWHADRR
jgi:hypothetical protein